ncbi:MAG: hypothetical protein K2H83_04795, partial [Duncaniella sp.]|nr:hypothetical protein [Duncaniella sp.]
YVYKTQGWTHAWYIFAAYALVVGVLFALIFKDSKTPTPSEARAYIEESDPAPAGETDTRQKK